MVPVGWSKSSIAPAAFSSLLQQLVALFDKLEHKPSLSIVLSLPLSVSSRFSQGPVAVAIEADQLAFQFYSGACWPFSSLVWLSPPPHPWPWLGMQAAGGEEWCLCSSCVLCHALSRHLACADGFPFLWLPSLSLLVIAGGVFDAPCGKNLDHGVLVRTLASAACHLLCCLGVFDRGGELRCTLCLPSATPFPSLPLCRGRRIPSIVSSL